MCWKKLEIGAVEQEIALKNIMRLLCQGLGLNANVIGDNYMKKYTNENGHVKSAKCNISFLSWAIKNKRRCVQIYVEKKSYLYVAFPQMHISKALYNI